MGTFSVYVRLGSVPSLSFDSFFPKHLSFILLDRNLEIVINRKMKLLFQLAMTFLALVCLAIAIPANHGHHGQMKDAVEAIPANHGHHGRMKDAVEAIPANHGHHGQMKDAVEAIPANHGHHG